MEGLFRIFLFLLNILFLGESESMTDLVDKYA